MFKSDSSTIWAGCKVVGEVVEGKFVKRVRGSVHMLREPRGWSFDLESLESARNLGAESVEIIDVETDVTYSAPIGRILDKGFRFNRGHGPQICLPLKFWNAHRHGEAQQLALALM